MEIGRVETDAELDDALVVRRRVFVEEQGVPEALEPDGLDGEATHFIAYDGNRDPIGAARLRETDEGVPKVERVAVLESRRGEGVGRALMDLIEETARTAGHDRLVLHAQTPVVGFYERLGYEATSETFLEAGIPHREMEKRLQRRG